MNRWRTCTILGLILGAGSVFSPGLLFMALLVFGVGFALQRLSPPREKRFLLALFLVGFLMRAGLSCALDLGSWAVEGRRPVQYGPVQDWDLGIFEKTREYLGMGDSDFHSQRGYALAQYARGSREPVVLFRIQQYGWSGYAYVIGFFYYLFGFSPVAVKMVNCLLGALLGPVIFALGKACFHSSVARWAAVSVALFPSLIFWSATNLKEASIALLTAFLLLLFAKMQREPRGKRLLALRLMFLAALLLHMTLRSILFSLAVVAGSAISLVILVLKRRGRWVVLTVLMGALLLAGRWEGWKGYLVPVFRYHIGYVGIPGISYQYLPEKAYEYGSSLEELSRQLTPLALASTIGRAVLQFLLQPFPWRIDNVAFLLAYVQMWFWYLMLPCALLGMGWSLAKNLDRSLFLVMTLALLTLLLALASGNVGTVFRIRDSLTPLFLLFASVGLWVLFKKGADPWAL